MSDDDPANIQDRDGHDIQTRQGEDIQPRPSGADPGPSPGPAPNPPAPPPSPISDLDPTEALEFDAYVSSTSSVVRKMRVRRGQIGMVLEGSTGRVELSVANLDARVLVRGAYADISKRVFG